MKLTITAAQLVALAQESISSRISEVEIAGTPIPAPPTNLAYSITPEDFDNAARGIEKVFADNKVNGGNLNKISLIRNVRAMTGLGLRDAKVLVEVLVIGRSEHIHPNG